MDLAASAWADGRQTGRPPCRKTGDRRALTRHFENFYCLDFFDPKFPDFQVPDFQISRNLAWAQLGPNLGPAWAQLGPTLGPAWAQLGWARLGPGLGLAWAPWARLGPGLGPAGLGRGAPAQTPPPDELSDPNLTPLPTHPGIKYVARTLAAMMAVKHVKNGSWTWCMVFLPLWAALHITCRSM